MQNKLGYLKFILRDYYSFIGALLFLMAITFLIIPVLAFPSNNLAYIIIFAVFSSSILIPIIRIIRANNFLKNGKEELVAINSIFFAQGMPTDGSGRALETISEFPELQKRTIRCIEFRIQSKSESKNIRYFFENLNYLRIKEIIFSGSMRVLLNDKRDRVFPLDIFKE